MVLGMVRAFSCPRACGGTAPGYPGVGVDREPPGALGPAEPSPCPSAEERGPHQRCRTGVGRKRRLDPLRHAEVTVVGQREQACRPHRGVGDGAAACFLPAGGLALAVVRGGTILWMPGAGRSVHEARECEETGQPAARSSKSERIGGGTGGSCVSPDRLRHAGGEIRLRGRARPGHPQFVKLRALETFESRVAVDGAAAKPEKVRAIPPKGCASAQACARWTSSGPTTILSG